MRRITCVTGCALALFCMLLWVPFASAQQTSAGGTPQPVAGPTIVVRMIDSVDSSRDPAGKQYRAGLMRPVNIGNGVIVAQGSVATVTLARNASGWGVQLSSVVHNGQVVPVTSNSGIVIGAAAQKGAADAATAAAAVLGQFARKPNTFPGFAAVATGERVMLTPGITLSFVLSAVPPLSAGAPAAGAAPAARAAQPPAAAAAGQSASAPAAKPSGQGASADYYCYAKYLPQWVRDNHGQLVRGSHTTHYITGVFQAPANADAGGALLSFAWETYIRNLFHLKPADGVLSCMCEKLAYVSAQQRVEQMEQGLKATKQELIHVDWKYVNTSPAPAAKQPAAANTAVQSAPAQAQKGWWWFCTTGPYISDVFFYPADIWTRADVDSAIKAAWASYSTRNYPTARGTGCTLAGDDQATAQRMRDTSGSGRIAVDWHYVPGQDKKTAAQTISASRDQTGEHPATAEVGGPTFVRCLTAKSDVPNPQPVPSCYITTHYNSFDLRVGGTSGFNGDAAVTVTLTCNGQGNRLQCTAAVGVARTP